MTKLVSYQSLNQTCSAVLLLSALNGCSASGSDSARGLSPSEGAADSMNGNTGVQAGVLTAGAWDDNRNFDFFLQYRSNVYAQNLLGLLPITADEHMSAFETFSQSPAPRYQLDVSLVIDTTGSMGDELSYLQAEFTAISNTIYQRHPDAQQRWSLVVYRDAGDAYVVRQFDFTTDLSTFQQNLNQQRADGGGDFPEAPDQAFLAMNQFAFRHDADTAKLVFWVADAPHHDDRASAFSAALRATRDRGVHVYPVASSGIDELTELTMRSAAQLTGGRYLFLTDDSGIGDSHKEPSIPCYFVTKLSDAIVRMVDIEMSGIYREPDPQQIIRTQGNPESGACALEQGQSVQPF
jgi:hypothetical protein